MVHRHMNMGVIEGNGGGWEGETHRFSVQVALTVAAASLPLWDLTCQMQLVGYSNTCACPVQVRTWSCILKQDTGREGTKVPPAVLGASA